MTVRGKGILDKEAFLKEFYARKKRKKSTSRYCIHGIHSDTRCEDCEKDYADGWIRERKTYSSSRLARVRWWLQDRCVQCGKPLDSEYKTYCLHCRKERNKLYQRVRGFAPWRPGGRGRTPKVK